MSNCVRCNVVITDETLRHTYFNEDYPDIDIGPYCIDCLSDVRICSGCHYPFIEGEDIKYFGDCKHYCDTCAEDVETCDVCNKVRSIHIEHDGKKMCEACFKRKYRKCKCCDRIADVVNFEYTTIELAKWQQLFDDYSMDICINCFHEKKIDYDPREVRECDNCSDIYGVTEGSDEHFCPRCCSYLPRCYDCGNVCLERRFLIYDEEHGERLHQHLCHECAPKWRECTVCGVVDKKLKKYNSKIKKHDVCTHCSELDLKECPSCLRLTELGESGYCFKCERKYYSNHCECGSIKDGRGACRVCEKGHTVIYNYTMKPHPVFHYTDKDVKKGEYLFLGIENEVSFESSSAQSRALKNLYTSYGPDILVAKSDASIGGYGYEIVTQPMTLDYFHKMGLQEMFPKTMRKKSSCGTHIHVGRNAIQGDSHLYKITNFVHNNKDFIDQVSGRDYNGYNHALKHKPSKTVLEVKKKGHGERHVRVNLNNKETIEFRMFTGCTKVFELRYRFEFIHALVTWTKDIPLNNSDVVEFCQFVRANKRDYPSLISFLKGV